MLGSVAEAEDIVQEAYIRWHRADRASVGDPLGYLVRVVTRLSLDHLKSARIRRERYVGTWLPEPLVEASDDDEADADISLTLMLALERLTPAERAAFLLHDVFGMGFGEIGETLSRTPEACRQLAARARRHVRSVRPRSPLAADEGRRIADAFFEASRNGDATALAALLAADVVVHADGGGHNRAALRPILGIEKVVRMFKGFACKADFARPPLLHSGAVNAMPGFVTIEPGGILQTTALEISDGRITAIYVMRNPEKLAHLSALAKK